MKSYDFEAVAYDGAVYCVGCCPRGVEDDTTPIFADSEWDMQYPPTCCHCGYVHDYVCLIDNSDPAGEEGDYIVKRRMEGGV